MKQYRIAGVLAASVLALGVFVSAQGPGAMPQGMPQGGGMPPGGRQGGGMMGAGGGTTIPRGNTVHITGENPGLQLRKEANGPILADFNFWRVSWSPVGVGHACYLTTGTGTGPNDLRIVLTESEKLANFVSNDTMSKLVPNFNTPAYKVITGATFSTEGDTLTERSEICKSPQYTIKATWRKITPGAMSGMQPNNGFLMTFIIHMASEGEISVNGKKLEGTVLPGQGRPPSYLAFAETWVKPTP